MIDDVTGKKKRGTTVVGEPIDEDFTVEAGGVTELPLATAITTPQVLDVFINGQLKREGASFDWLRSVALQKITFVGLTVPEGSWVRVRRYL